MKHLTLGSLFDGSGGFPLGASLYGIVPLWASEIEPFAVRVTTKRFPNMKHLGDISHINGGAVPPVDIITFGSPCTDLSVAGKRTGLGGKHSSLFYEAIRIVKEMREATNGQFPRFIIFENVQGAFHSSRGADFNAILDAIIQIVEPGAEVPAADKGGWPYADILVGDGWSVAYRLVDAQFFGVAQRRKRVYLVADFGSDRAGEILFERESVSRDFTPGGSPWESSAGNPPGDAGAAGGTDFSNIARTLTSRHDSSPCADRGMNIVAVHHNQVGELRVGDVANTLSINGNATGRTAPLVAAFMAGQGAKAGSIAYSENISPTLKGASPCAVMQTYVIQGSMIGRNDKNGPQGDGINENVSFTLNTVDRHAVAFDCRNQTIAPISSTLQAKNNGGQSLNYINPVFERYIVRRLTPQECAQLQGFARDFCAGLEMPEPTEADIEYWSEVWETHRRIIGKAAKPKTRNQIVKWLRHPYSDSAEYKLWGNGVALPCVCFVMAGICEASGFPARRGG